MRSRNDLQYNAADGKLCPPPSSVNLFYNGALCTRYEDFDVVPGGSSYAQEVPGWFLGWGGDYAVTVKDGEFGLVCNNAVSGTRTLQFTVVDDLLPNTQYHVAFGVRVTSGTRIQIQFVGIGGDSATPSYTAFTGTGEYQIIEVTFTTPENVKRMRIGLCTYGAEFSVGKECTMFWGKLEHGEALTEPYAVNTHAAVAGEALGLSPRAHLVHCDVDSSDYIVKFADITVELNGTYTYSVDLWVSKIQNIQNKNNPEQQYNGMGAIVRCSVRIQGGVLSDVALTLLAGDLELSKFTACWDEAKVYLYVDCTVPYDSYAVRVLCRGINYSSRDFNCSIKLCNEVLNERQRNKVVMTKPPIDMMGNVVVDGIAYQVVGTQRFGFPAFDRVDSNIKVEQSAYPDLEIGQVFYFGGWLITVSDLDTDSDEEPLWLLQVQYETYASNIWTQLANSHTVFTAYRVVPATVVPVYNGSYTTVNLAQNSTRDITLPLDFNLFRFIDFDIQYGTTHSVVRALVSDMDKSSSYRTYSLGIGSDYDEYLIRFSISRVSDTKIRFTMLNFFQRSTTGALTGLTSGSCYIQEVFLVP